MYITKQDFITLCTMSDDEEPSEVYLEHLANVYEGLDLNALEVWSDSKMAMLVDKYIKST